MSNISDIIKQASKIASVQIKTLEQSDDADVSYWFETGFPNVDRILGGGLPGGRCSEAAGLEAKGKSAFCQTVAVKHTQRGGLVVYIDVENAVEKRKLISGGVNPDLLLYHTPTYVEEGWKVVNGVVDAMRKVAHTKDYIPPLFVWDSIPVGETEAETKNVKVGIAGVARVASDEIRAMYRNMRDINGHFIFVNQMTKKFKSMGFGDQYETKGARAVRFVSSIRMTFSAYAIPNKGLPKTGLMVKIYTGKNKVAPPYQSTSVVIDFKRGMCVETTAFELLRRSGQIKPTKKQEGKFFAAWTKPFAPEKWYEMMQQPDFRKLVLDKLALCGPAKYEGEDSG